MKLKKGLPLLSLCRGVAALLLLVAVPNAHAQEYVPGEVLVKFKAGPFSGGRESARIGARQIDVVRGVGVTRVRLPRGMSVEMAAAHFGKLPSVEFAEPNYLLHLLSTPNDPLFGSQWSLAKIRAPQAWDITTGSSAVKVAVLDSGYDTTHPDLAGKVVLAQDFTVVDGTNDVNDYNGHGTLCAGIVASYTDNVLGVASIGWETSLMIGKTFGDDGWMRLNEVANAIDWATENGAKVISMSFSIFKGTTTLKNAVDNAWNRGVVLVAAAGNSNDSANQYPAAYTNCIAVAATDSSDNKAGFSNFGRWVNVAAPGVSILTTARGGGYATVSGTSMAAPLVAGLTALVWATPHGISAASVRNRIETTGVPVTNGFGRYPTRRIDALAAVQ